MVPVMARDPHGHYVILVPGDCQVRWSM